MRHIYCPHCGTKLGEKEIGDEGMVPFCAKCDRPIWDSFTTSIIAAVINDEREVALLRQGYVSADTYVCVAGIMKPGESAEDAAIREIREEIGQDVIEIRYKKSFPYPQKDMLMLGFCARVRKEPIVISGEVDAARWVRFDEALSLIREGSVAWQLVKSVIEE
jgi:NAD+ diphosphatase